MVKRSLPHFDRFRWADFILPSTLQLAPLLEILIEPVGCLATRQRVQLGLHEALEDGHELVHVGHLPVPAMLGRCHVRKVHRAHTASAPVAETTEAEQ